MELEDTLWHKESKSQKEKVKKESQLWLLFFFHRLNGNLTLDEKKGTYHYLLLATKCRLWGTALAEVC